MRVKIGSFLAALASLGVVNIASAADMAARAPVYSAPAAVVAPSWVGSYIGLDIGWIGSRNRVTDINGLQDDPGTTHTYSKSGLTGGVYAGYNWQATNWVYGVEADFSGASVKSSHLLDDTPNSGFDLDGTAATRVSWTSTYRGRVGFLVTPETLFYATGGLALAHIKNSETDTDASVVDPGDSVSRTSTRSSWVAGGGVEHMFSPNMIGRIEGLYMAFHNETLVTPGNDAFTFRNKIATVRAGLAWKW
jgi:outer membrane immunogenic protein